MDLSDRTKNYIAELMRQGADFDYSKWLDQVKSQKAQSSKSAPDCDLAANDKATCPPEPLQDPHVLATNLFRHAARPRGQKQICTSVDQDLDNVCDAWGDVQKDRRRDGIYDYLSRVFSLVRKFRARGKLHRLIREAQRRGGLEANNRAEPFAAVIRATTRGFIDRRAVSKYSRVLRFARRFRKGGQSFKAFVKAHGGINACAIRYVEAVGSEV